MTDTMREKFVVKHYSEDESPVIKYDGGYIEVVGDWQDAEDFLSAIYKAAQADARALVGELVRCVDADCAAFEDTLTKAQAFMEGK